MKVVSLFSGGKDSLFAFYKAKEDGLDVRYLLNFIISGKGRFFSHHLGPEFISHQAESIGLPLIKRHAPKGTSEEVFKDAFFKLKEEGVEGGVFGDIYLEDHRSWIHRVCKKIGIETFFPLWMRPTLRLSFEFVESGFEAVVVSVKKELLPKEYVGRVFDRGFIKELYKRGLDPCGERGEFHTFVVNGPIFKERITIRNYKVLFQDKYWCLYPKKR
jgi:uncharacterized protein (TIGR00290 family)